MQASQPNRRPLHPLLGVGLLSLLALLALAGIKSYRELGGARAREARLEAEIRQAEERQAQLAERVEKLRNDPAAIEREVRRSLRWIGPDEVVLVVPEPAPEPTMPPSETPSPESPTSG
jgi:cell division protein FtsB